MRLLTRFAAIVSIVAMLATLSFAAPMCRSCSPNTAVPRSASAQTRAHEHCGSAQAEEPDAPSMEPLRCGQDAAVCMTAIQREIPVLQTSPSIQFIPALTLPAATIEIAKKSSPPPTKALDSSPNLVLLTANLRV